MIAVLKTVTSLNILDQAWVKDSLFFYNSIFQSLL